MLDAPYPPSTYCMRSSDLVELIDHTGRATGAKPRSQIDKTRDVYHGVYVLLMTPTRELVLSEIPERSDLPNLYVHKLGVTAATMRRVVTPVISSEAWRSPTITIPEFAIIRTRPIFRRTLSHSKTLIPLK